MEPAIVYGERFLAFYATPKDVVEHSQKQR
jgi:hypothetical protein